MAARHQYHRGMIGDYASVAYTKVFRKLGSQFLNVFMQGRMHVDVGRVPQLVQLILQSIIHFPKERFMSTGEGEDGRR